jgi:hypothetical protein
MYLGSIDGGEPRRLSANASTSGTYLPTGMVAWVQNGALVARRLDLERAELVGEQITLANNVSYNPGSHRGGFSIAEHGEIAYRANTAAKSQLTWYDPAGNAVGVIGQPENNLNHLDLLPDAVASPFNATSRTTATSGLRICLAAR